MTVGLKKTRVMPLPKKSEKFEEMFIRLDTIPQRDGQAETVKQYRALHACSYSAVSAC